MLKLTVRAGVIGHLSKDDQEKIKEAIKLTINSIPDLVFYRCEWNETESLSLGDNPNPMKEKPDNWDRAMWFDVDEKSPS